MKLPFFGKQDEERVIDANTIFLALDIGTEYVKSSIFQVRDKKAHIIGYSRVPQHSNAMEGAMIINIENVVSACDIGIGQALAVADKTLGRKCEIPEYVVMGISGELVKGVSITAHYEREDPDSTITQEELDEVVNSVKEQAFPDSVEEIAEQIGTQASKISEINSHINATYIDGNKVNNPLGFTGQEVTYRVFSTFTPSIHLNSMHEIAKRLELEVLTIEVQPYAISRTFKGSHKSTFSSIFIDIGGGTTDLALVDGGAISGTKMIGFGGRVFTKRISKDMNIDLAEAENMKIDYSSKKLSAATESKIRKALAKDGKLWAESIEIALAEFDDIENFPSDFLISGGGSELPEIRENLLAYPWTKVLPFARFPKIKFIYPNQISNIVDETNLLISSADIAPAALTSITVDFVS